MNDRSILWQKVRKLDKFRSQFPVTNLPMRWGVSDAHGEHISDEQTRKDLFVCETTTGELVIFPILKPTLSNGSGTLRERMMKTVRMTFDQIDADSFEAIQISVSSAQFSFGDSDGEPALKIELSNCNLRNISIPLTSPTEHPFIGDWGSRWQPEIPSLLEGRETSTLCALHHQSWEVAKDSFGATLVKEATPILLEVDGKRAQIFPNPGKIRWLPIGIQRETEGEHETTTIVLEDQYSFYVHRFEAHESGDSREVQKKVNEVVAETTGRDFSSIQTTKDLGVFEAIDKSGSLRKILLYRSTDGVSHLKGDGEETEFDSGFTTSGHFILTHPSHQSLLIKGNGMSCERLSEEVKPYEIDQDISFTNNSLSGVFFQDVPEIQTALVEVTVSEFRINGERKFDFSSRFSFTHQDVDSSILKLLIFVGEEPLHSIELLGPKENILTLCRFLEKRRVLFSSSTEKASTLYGQLIETRKLSFLNTVFGDIALIHRALNEGMSMDEVVRKVQAASEKTFVENPTLKQETVEKLTILAVAIPRLRQKLEILRLSYPYSWANVDSKWLLDVFGERAAGLSAREHEASVQRFRVAITRAQGEMQRSLTSIESALRPITSLLAREEVEKSWMTKVQKFTPLILTGAGALAAAAAGPLGPMGFMVMAGLGGNGISILARSAMGQKESERTFRHAAEEVFPWWNIFLQSFGVSASEVSRFVENESQRAMKRDRQIFDSLPTDEKRQVGMKMTALLSEQLARESANQFFSVSGSDGLLIQDLSANVHILLSEQSLGNTNLLPEAKNK